MPETMQNEAAPSIAIRRLRAELRTEFEIAGVSSEVLRDLDKTLDALAVEIVVLTASEVLAESKGVLARALARACVRANATSYAAPSELVDRVCYDVSSRAAALNGYHRLLSQVASAELRIPAQAPAPSVQTYTAPLPQPQMPTTPRSLTMQAIPWKKLYRIGLHPLTLWVLRIVLVFSLLTAAYHYFAKSELAQLFEHSVFVPHRPLPMRQQDRTNTEEIHWRPRKH